MDIARRDIRHLGDRFNAILARVDTSALGGMGGENRKIWVARLRKLG